MSAKEAPQLLTVAEAGARLGLTEAGIRHRIFHDTDGFSTRCVVRVGRSVRIREDRLAEFIDEHTGAEPWDTPWRDKLGRPPKAAA